jgi:hypothetical protein
MGHRIMSLSSSTDAALPETPNTERGWCKTCGVYSVGCRVLGVVSRVWCVRCRVRGVGYVSGAPAAPSRG